MRVALTGGIGSGKTTVSQMFADHGIPVIDADEISRSITRCGGAAFDRVVDLLGRSALGHDGELRRDYIRHAVFEDAGLRSRMEEIIHPLVYAEIERRMADIDSPYCLISVPLLLESGMSGAFDRVLVVDLPEALQLRRTSERDHLPEAEIRKIMETQSTRGARLQAADDVIRNDSDLEHLRAEVERLHRSYLQLANTRVAGST
jgi:dephospho-CoA kinase